jgi:hypothetical protein
MEILEFDAQNVMEQEKLNDSKGRLGAHGCIAWLLIIRLDGS